MPWLQVILDTAAQNVEVVSDHLMAMGAVSVTLQEAQDQSPVYEPPLNTTPLWGCTQVVGLFEEGTDSVALQIQLQQVLGAFSQPPYQIQTLEDQEWTRICLNDFHPMRFGQRVWVCPSWQTPPEPEAINILLDPGLAFGTGTHTTTALCLEWLDQQETLVGKTVMDYGCGSGILAIAAAKLGATAVWAVDNDPQALFATQDNAQKNGVNTLITTGLAESKSLNFKVDIILANILASPLILLTPRLTAMLNQEGVIVLSGILNAQTNDVLTAYQPHFHFSEILERENWMRIVAQKI